MSRSLLLRTLMLICLACLVFPACDGGMVGGPDSGLVGEGGALLPDCAASQQSGKWLLAFGPVTQEVNAQGAVQVTVIVNQRGEKEGQGKAVAGQAVKFKIITPDGDAKLNHATSNTDGDGLASAAFTAGKKAQLYQVQASSDGTCAVYFSIDVKQPLRQLRAVTPSPFDTFTNSRVPIAVEARTDGFAKLAGEEITFKVTTGATSETTLSVVGVKGGGPTVKVKTNGAGLATVMLNTGSAAISQLLVVASMSGTADASVVVRIQKGLNKGCTSDSDCPLGYNCKAGKCQPPVVTPSTGCKSTADCNPPLICQTTTGKCLKGTGKACDPVEGTGCAPDEVCIGQECAKLPGGCTDNSACPSGFKCVGGKCVPQGKPPTGGCVTNKDCPSGQACINGVCKPKGGCKIVHKPDRLKGTWKFDSMLHLRDALNPVLKGVLGTAGTLSTIINGKFSIKGVPSFINKIVQKYLKSLVSKYVPPWGQQLITALGAINDIANDMRVLSTVQTTSAGTDAYINSEQWNLVEFKFQGKKISSPPSAIPQVGQVQVSNYMSYEVCGNYTINKHKIKNKVGGIVKWAIETALALVTCNVKGVPCFNSVTQALNQSINCAMLGMQVDQMVQSLWSGAPSVASIIAAACNSEKNKLINKLNKELNNLSVKLSLLELSGTVAIPSPGADHKLSGGKWNGVLAGGNFKGEFSATKGP